MNILGFMFKKSWDDCLIEIADVCNVFRVEKIITETNGVGNIIVKELNKLGANVEGRNTTINKTTKIMASAVYKDSIKLSNATDIYKQENKTFNSNVKIVLELIVNYFRKYLLIFNCLTITIIKNKE